MVASPYFVDNRRESRAALFERRGIKSFRVRKAIERTILSVEDVNLVMSVGLGEKDAEIGVSEFEIDGLVGDLNDGIVPPRDALLFVQGAGNAFVERVLDEHAFALACRLVGRPARIGNYREEHKPEEGDRDPNYYREAAEVSAEMLGEIESSQWLPPTKERLEF